MDRWTWTIARSLLPLLVVAALAACAGPKIETGPPSSSTPTVAASASPAPDIVATLGIYSGRPDPSWTLTDAQAGAVIAAIAALPVATGVPPEGGLGYHGFSVVLPRPGRADETVVAYRSTVAPPGVGPRPHRSDPGRTVERLLLDTGRAMLTSAEIAAVEADLTASP